MDRGIAFHILPDGGLTRMNIVETRRCVTSRRRDPHVKGV